MDLIAPVLKILRDSSSYGALHVCRGNYTKEVSGLLSGSYASLSDFFSLVQPDILTLEFSTPRAGDIGDLFINEYIADQTMLGLGVVNPKTEEIEDVEYIISKVEETLKYLPPEKIWFNPDCGFATFETRPMNSFQVISDKITTMKKAQTILRKKHTNYR